MSILNNELPKNQMRVFNYSVPIPVQRNMSRYINSLDDYAYNHMSHKFGELTTHYNSFSIMIPSWKFKPSIRIPLKKQNKCKVNK